MDDEAAVAGRDRGEVDLGREARGLAEHHVAVARIEAVLPGPSPRVAPMMRSSKPSPLTSPAEDTETPEKSMRILAMDDEAAVAGRDGGEVDLRREARGLAEHHVAGARIGACVAGAIAVPGPDDEVVEAVTVDVAGRGDRNAGLIVRVLAVDDESAVAGRDRGEVDLGREARGLAEHHVAVARIVACVAGAIAAKCPDDEVVEAVAVDVAGRG